MEAFVGFDAYKGASQRKLLREVVPARGEKRPSRPARLAVGADAVRVTP